MPQSDLDLLGVQIAEYRFDNPGESVDSEDFGAGFERGLAAARAQITEERSLDPHRNLLDNDTEQDGVNGPFKYWEDDHTALVHVLWSARSAGLTLRHDPDEIASRIHRSRWFAAVKAAARAPYPLTSVRQLDAVAAGHVIHSAEGNVWESVWEATEFGHKVLWQEARSSDLHPSTDIALPATTLFDPKLDETGPSTPDVSERAAARLALIEEIIDDLHEVLPTEISAELNIEKVVAAVRAHIDDVPKDVRRRRTWDLKE